MNTEESINDYIWEEFRDDRIGGVPAIITQTKNR